MTWHALPVGEAYEQLGTRKSGLTAEEAGRRLEQYGPNELPAAGGSEALKILIRQIHDPVIYVLLGSTGLAILTGKVFDGLVILGVIVLNAIIGFVHEYRASPGDKVPADLRLVEVRTLKVEEAALTGESVPSLARLRSA